MIVAQTFSVILGKAMKWLEGRPFYALHGSTLRIVISEGRRRSCSRESFIIRFRKYFIKFTGKHLCQSLFLNKVAGIRPAFLLKRDFRHRCFPIDFVKIFKDAIFSEHLLATASRSRIHIKS